MSGNQKSEYFKEYYKRNKKKIADRNKALYEKRRSTPEGLKAHREKATEYTRKYRERNKQKVKDSRRALYLRRKRDALEMVGGAFCSNCGCDDMTFLEFNHIHGGGCKDIKGNSPSLADRVLNGSLDSKKINVLCRVCNALDHLLRKSESAKSFKVIWEDFTGKKSELIKNDV